ncbi:MAG: hypothetical protein RR867_07660 [Ruthenibacterium sp.]
MLKKLIKYEFRTTGKIMLPLFGAALILAGTTKLFLTVGYLMLRNAPDFVFGNNFLRGAGMLLTVLTVFALIALMMVVFINSALRFYKNLLGDEGYLMFTLPATAGQHVFSKLLVSLCWTVGGILFSVGVALLLSGGVVAVTTITSNGTTSISFGAMLQQYAESGLGNGVYWIIPLLVLLVFVGITCQYLMLYLAMAIGAQWPNNRLPASIGAYLGIGFILQICMFFGMLIVGFVGMQTSWFAEMAQFMINNPMAAANTMFGIVAVGAVLCSLLFFFVTRWLLSKKLNLA